MALNDYPIDVRADYPERSSRGWAALTIFLIKFLALIPHFFVLIFLGIAQFVVALIAQVAVVVNGEYPAGMHAFVTGVLRWGTRVCAFMLSLSDRYPPFTLRPVDDYPVDVLAERPAQSSRLYALFTVVVEVVFIAAMIALAVHFARQTGVDSSAGQSYNFSGNAGTGLLLRQIAALPHLFMLFILGIAVFVLWVVLQWVILFSARFPRGMFDFVAGFVRWQTRVTGYALGLSDRYPPFTLEAPAQESPSHRSLRHRSLPRSGTRTPAAATPTATGTAPMDAERGRRREDRQRSDRRSRSGPSGAERASAGGGTLKAMVHSRYGSPDVLELKDIDKPVVKDDEVLVRVRSAAVNPPDWAGVHGLPYIVRLAYGLRRPKLGIRGTDMAGIVDAVGKNVTRLRVGDEVFGRGAGTFAEYAVAPEDLLVPKPAAITFEQAAAVPMSGLTALQALRDAGGIRQGQKVLIVGAGGGVGSFAVQIAKSFGAEVTGVCSASKQDLVRSIGADHIIDYAQEDFTQGEQRYDLVLDNVLQHSLSELLRALSRSGTLVPNGGQFYKRWFASTGVLLIKAPLLSLVVPQRIRVCSERPSQDDLLVLKELMESGKLTPVVGSTYPLSRVREAISFFGEGHAEGKVVITM